MPGVGFNLSQSLKQQQTLAPQMRQGLKMLQMTSLELRAELQHEIDRYKDVPSPAIILIPGREGPLGLGQSALVAAVERAVGTNILQ